MVVCKENMCVSPTLDRGEMTPFDVLYKGDVIISPGVELGEEIAHFVANVTHCLP